MHTIKVNDTQMEIIKDLFKNDVDFMNGNCEMTCENCKHFKTELLTSYCNNEKSMCFNLYDFLEKDDGCNKWEVKEDE